MRHLTVVPDMDNDADRRMALALSILSHGDTDPERARREAKAALLGAGIDDLLKMREEED